MENNNGFSQENFSAVNFKNDITKHYNSSLNSKVFPLSIIRFLGRTLSKWIIQTALNELIDLIFPNDSTITLEELLHETEKLLDTKLDELELERIQKELEGLKNAVSVYDELINTITNKRLPLSKDDVDLIIGSANDLHMLFEDRIPQFQNELRRELLLPLFSQAATLHLLFLKQFAIEGLSWGVDAQFIDLFISRFKATVEKYTNYTITTFRTEFNNKLDKNPLLDEILDYKTFMSQTVLNIAHQWPFLRYDKINIPLYKTIFQNTINLNDAVTNQRVNCTSWGNVNRYFQRLSHLPISLFRSKGIRFGISLPEGWGYRHYQYENIYGIEVNYGKSGYTNSIGSTVPIESVREIKNYSFIKHLLNKYNRSDFRFEDYGAEFSLNINDGETLGTAENSRDWYTTLEPPYNAWEFENFCIQYSNTNGKKYYGTGILSHSEPIEIGYKDMTITNITALPNQWDTVLNNQRNNVDSIEGLEVESFEPMDNLISVFNHKHIETLWFGTSLYYTIPSDGQGVVIPAMFYSNSQRSNDIFLNEKDAHATDSLLMKNNTNIIYNINTARFTSTKEYDVYVRASSVNGKTILKFNATGDVTGGDTKMIEISTDEDNDSIYDMKAKQKDIYITSIGMGKINGASTSLQFVVETADPSTSFELIDIILQPKDATVIY